jgi:isoleucyl-tRNA synthetase
LKGVGGGYEFTVPLLPGDHVTDDTGTGFVHTAPGHGREDFDVWMANARELEARGINTTIPYTVDENGALTDHAPGFTGKRVINDKGEKGDANEAVIKALIEAGARPAQASIPAFLAFEEAGDLPQYAAMVHRDGQGYCK